MNWFRSFWKKLTAPPPAAQRVSVHSPGKITPGAPHVLLSAEVAGNFTPRAQQVLALARIEANRFHHNFIGTEHLLLGLVALGQGTAVNVLRNMGVNLESVRDEIEKQVGTGPDQECIGYIPYTPRVKKVVALAAKQARALNHTYVGTEHILLGLLAEGDGVAARVLKNLGVEVETTRQQILQELDPNYRPSADATGASPSSPPSPAPKSASPQPQGEAVDISKRYDIYCSNWSQGVIIYRNARFKGMKHLFQRSQYDALSGYVELELSDGQTIFVSRSSVIRFCEPGVTPGPEGDPGGKP